MPNYDSCVLSGWIQNDRDDFLKKCTDKHSVSAKPLVTLSVVFKKENRGIEKETLNTQRRWISLVFGCWFGAANSGSELKIQLQYPWKQDSIKPESR